MEGTKIRNKNELEKKNLPHLPCINKKHKTHFVPCSARGIDLNLALIRKVLQLDDNFVVIVVVGRFRGLRGRGREGDVAVLVGVVADGVVDVVDVVVDVVVVVFGVVVVVVVVAVVVDAAGDLLNYLDEVVVLVEDKVHVHHGVDFHHVVHEDNLHILDVGNGGDVEDVGNGGQNLVCLSVSVRGVSYIYIKIVSGVSVSCLSCLIIVLL